MRTISILKTKRKVKIKPLINEERDYYSFTKDYYLIDERTDEVFLIPLIKDKSFLSISKIDFSRFSERTSRSSKIKSKGCKTLGILIKFNKDNLKQIYVSYHYIDLLDKNLKSEIELPKLEYLLNNKDVNFNLIDSIESDFDEDYEDCYPSFLSKIINFNPEINNDLNNSIELITIKE